MAGDGGFEPLAKCNSAAALEGVIWETPMKNPLTSKELELINAYRARRRPAR